MQEQDHFEEEQKPSLLKKIFLGIGGILLILLLLSLTLFEGPVGSILRGQLQSAPLANNQVTIDGITLHFTNGIGEELRQRYLKEQRVEWTLCLQGTKEDTTYVVMSYYQPKVFSQSVGHVTSESCSQDTLVIFHTHPYKSCLASDQDIITLRRNQERNKDVLMVIMCEPERFALYR